MVEKQTIFDYVVGALALIGFSFGLIKQLPKWLQKIRAARIQGLTNFLQDIKEMHSQAVEEGLLLDGSEMEAIIQQ